MKDPQRLINRRVVWDCTHGLFEGVVVGVLSGTHVYFRHSESELLGLLREVPINRLRQFQEPPRTREWFESLPMLDEVE